MERRNFLKGMFGAAVVAAMPIAVVNRIESQNVEPHSSTDTTPINTIWCDASDNILLIYDEKRLIGFSNLFTLDFQSPSLIDISSLSSEVWKGARKKPTKKHPKGKKIYESDYGSPEYWKASKSWSLNASMMNWDVSPMEYMEGHKMLNCLIKHDNMKIVGSMYITSHTLSIPMDDQISGIATFDGSGELTVIFEKG